MRKAILQPEKFIKTIGILYLFVFLANSTPAEKNHNLPIDLDDLLFYERIIIDFYAGGENREIAIRDLETRCRFRDTGTGLSCANLAILYKNQKDLPKAYTSAAIAYKKEPNNSYYRNLFQNLAIRSGNLKDMEKRMGRDGRTISRIGRVVQNCNEGLGSKAFTDISLLVNQGHITREQLERGLFHECLSHDPKNLGQLLAIAKPNPHSYTKLLREEEDRFNPYHKVWDLDYYRDETQGKLTDRSIPSTELTESWVSFKNALAEDNAMSAKKFLSEVKGYLDGMKKKGGKNKIIAESLDLAIRLTITQDPDFKTKAKKMSIDW